MASRDHAFGGACVFLKPSVQWTLWLSQLFRHPMLVAKGIASYYLSPMRFHITTAWRNLACQATFDESLRIGPNAWCSNYQGAGRKSEITFGPNSILRGVIRVDFEGKVVVGSDVYVGDDVIISSACGVTIGAHTLIAHGVHIFDNDSHPIDWMDRMIQNQSYRTGRASEGPEIGKARVDIGNHVWIGFNALIFKGVKIGDRSIIAAGSVVTKDIPADCVAAGNPARIVKELPVGRPK